ncbi:hypothetical protein GCM10017600_60590 [Streptosporangium carneum]|uniref:Uncharacterized protein n=1 Tax=Streptosporangium carneum TaxID=47481 RepID=A0A9W6I828_9ACTN|nr:hypothetical protein GCM10017600_60590 [Streptosporangium carneum]
MSRRLRFTSSRAPSADKPVDQVDREDPGQWWRASNGSGCWSLSGSARTATASTGRQPYDWWHGKTLEQQRASPHLSFAPRPGLNPG